MKKFYWTNLVLLILLSFNTAIVKLLRLDFEMELFRKVGIADAATIGFGVFQLIGAILLCVPKARRLGALVMAVSFIAASAVVFSAGMIPFGVGSLLFIAMAVWPLRNPTGPI